MNIIQRLSILTMLIFYGSYFGKQLIQQFQGIQTNRLARGKKPKRTFLIEFYLKIATFSMAVLQLFSLSIAERWPLLLLNKTARYTGIGIALLGSLLFIISIITMQNSWRAGVDSSQKTKLVKAGIYKVSRNPAFLGFDLFYIGFTLAFCNPIQLILLILCILLLHLQILEEENFLLTVFGSEYINYKKSVHRYFLFF